MPTHDTTRRTLSQVRRMPQWQRLIDSVHKAQELAGYDGRQFGRDEVEHFGSTFIGKPVEHVARQSRKPEDFAASWVERQAVEMSGETFVTYVLKTVYGDALAEVKTINRSEPAAGLTPSQDAALAAEFVSRSMWVAGRGR
jgi:hypothetical protein